jgi:hypothetical protein
MVRSTKLAAEAMAPEAIAAMEFTIDSTTSRISLIFCRKNWTVV